MTDPPSPTLEFREELENPHPRRGLPLVQVRLRGCAHGRTRAGRQSRPAATHEFRRIGSGPDFRSPWRKKKSRACSKTWPRAEPRLSSTGMATSSRAHPRTPQAPSPCWVVCHPRPRPKGSQTGPSAASPTRFRGCGRGHGDDVRDHGPDRDLRFAPGLLWDRDRGNRGGLHPRGPCAHRGARPAQLRSGPRILETCAPTRAQRGVTPRGRTSWSTSATP